MVNDSLLDDEGKIKDMIFAKKKSKDDYVGWPYSDDPTICNCLPKQYCGKHGSAFREECQVCIQVDIRSLLQTIADQTK